MRTDVIEYRDFISKKLNFVDINSLVEMCERDLMTFVDGIELFYLTLNKWNPSEKYHLTAIEKKFHQSRFVSIEEQAYC